VTKFLKMTYQYLPKVPGEKCREILVRDHYEYGGVVYRLRLTINNEVMQVQHVLHIQEIQSFLDPEQLEIRVMAKLCSAMRAHLRNISVLK